MIQNNGRNTSAIISFRKSDGNYCGRLFLDRSALALRLVRGDSNQALYEIAITVADGIHRGYILNKFIFQFTIERDQQNGMQATTYPAYLRNDAVECVFNSGKKMPKECN